MQTVQLPQDYALVMQQIDENGEEDFTNLSETLQLDRQRLTHVILALRHKGLIQLHTSANASWIKLSTKGQRLMAYLWPESALHYT
jgi:DNA-binding MarR family transcriptional regulator